MARVSMNAQVCRRGWADPMMVLKRTERKQEISWAEIGIRKLGVVEKQV